jgi:hypothetical protein
MRKVWVRCWEKELTQERIQAWIRRIPRAIEQILKLRGGNEYKEGQEGGSILLYNKDERKQRYRSRKTGVRPGDDEVAPVDDAEVEEEEMEEVDDADW